MTINLENTLEILCPTYNRAPFLKNTLEQLFAPNSPVKNCHMTFLDNASTDDTPRLLAQYAAQHPNIRIIRHNRNIGGDANIARAFEEVTYPRYWIVCDDDDFHWEHWPEVQKALEKDIDLIITTTQIFSPQVKKAHLPLILTFVPAGIHKSKYLDSLTLMRMHFNVQNHFPQLAPAAQVFNNNGSIYISQHNLVTFGKNDNNPAIWWQETQPLPPTYKYRKWDPSYLNSLELFTDKPFRTQAVEAFAMEKGFSYGVQKMLKKNFIFSENFFRNIADPWNVMSSWQRVRYAINVLFFFLIKLPFKYLRYNKMRKEYRKKVMAAIQAKKEQARQ